MAFVEYKGVKYEVKSDELNLYDLDIEKISDIKGLENIKYLRTLWLQNNNISDLSGFPPSFYVSRLILENNKITSMRELEGLRNVFLLSLEKNQITKIEGLSNYTGLWSLNLSHNQITVIENLDNLVNLEVLCLNDNNIEELKGIENLGNLKHLYLSGNPFSKNYNEYTLAHKNNSAAPKIEYVRRKIGHKTDHIAKKLLNIEECEFLDFKADMYKINDPDFKTKLEEKKEFLKDILGLVHNFREDKSLGLSYLLIGVAESNRKYNGFHQNIDFNNLQTLKDVINANIRPETISLDLEEFYISGNASNILILKENKFNYDRNILLKIQYVPGTHYEFKKNFGNPQLGVPYYIEGTSFYRDGSHTRPMIGVIREEIRALSLKNKIPNEINQSLLKCYKSIKELCTFQFENIPYKDTIHRNRIEKIIALLTKYKDEMIEYLDVLFEAKKLSKYSKDFIDEYNIELNDLRITIFMRLDYIADVFMHLKEVLVIDQTKIRPFLIKIKNKLGD